MQQRCGSIVCNFHWYCLDFHWLLVHNSETIREEIQREVNHVVGVIAIAFRLDSNGQPVHFNGHVGGLQLGAGRSDPQSDERVAIDVSDAAARFPALRLLQLRRQTQPQRRRQTQQILHHRCYSGTTPRRCRRRRRLGRGSGR